jgi:hypothetical protein
MASPCPTWANAGGESPETKIALTIHFAFIAFVLETTSCGTPALSWLKIPAYTAFVRETSKGTFW